MIKMIWIPIFTLSALSARASIVAGTTQEIAIVSIPSGANCDVGRGGVSLQRVTTPASALVQKDTHDIAIQCSKPGFESTTIVSKSGVDPWVFGNILFGGIIGLIIDVSDGAADRYDNTTDVTLPMSAAFAPIVPDPGIVKGPVM